MLEIPKTTWWDWILRRRPKPADPVCADEISADVPIRSASEDLLRRVTFASRIADILAASKVREGRVFAIRGSWGQGKSSLKNLIIEQLDGKSPQTPWLEFNPWQWGSGDAIARAPFLHMAANLGGKNTPVPAPRAATVRKYGAIVGGAGGRLGNPGDDKSSALTWVGGGTATVLGLWGVTLTSETVTGFLPYVLLVGGLLALAGRIVGWLGRDRSSEPLSDVRKDLEDRLLKLERPLIIFVDDIDRLEQDQIRLVFRQIKVNANLPNIVFVLLYQPSIVETALREVAGEDGAAYLEKIVQANFDLPALPADKIFRIFSEQLALLLDHLATPENGFDERRWGNVMIGGIKLSTAV